MNQRSSDPSRYAVAIALAALAGWVDATSLSRWHGLYVSFMSGNSTALGAAASSLQWFAICQLVGVIASFVAGVVAGEAVFQIGGPRSYSYVLGLEAALLGLAAIANWETSHFTATALILGLAMGMQNASVHRVGGISVALTYVTGTLVHFGRAIAAGITGKSSWTDGLPYLGLWAALVVGAALGALTVSLSAEWAIGVAALGAACLALLPLTGSS